MIRRRRLEVRMWKRRSSVECIFWSSWRPRRNFIGRQTLQGQNVHNLGRTRSAQQPNHLLLTPDTFVRTNLPGMKNCTAVVHVGPALGAAFTLYTAEFESGGELG